MNVTGTVKWYNMKKGYGFIQSEANVKDIFIHATLLQKSGLKRLLPGQKVRFEIYDDKGRPAAENVEIINQ